MSLKFLSLYVFVLTLACVIYLAFIKYIFSANLFDIIIPVVSAILMIWARITPGDRSFHPAADVKKCQVIIDGKFRRIRHLINVLLNFFFAASLISFSLFDVIIALLLIVAGLFAKLLLEERALKEIFKEQYVRYEAGTKRIIPYVFCTDQRLS